MLKFNLINFSKILLIVFPLLMSLMGISYIVGAAKFYCFGIAFRQIILGAVIFLVVISILLAVITLRARRLLTKEAIKSLLLYFIKSLIVSFIILLFFSTFLCARRDDVYNARKILILKTIASEQKEFYKDNLRYASSPDELFLNNVDILTDIDEFNIFLEVNNDRNSWKAYSFTYKSEREKCGKKREAFFCNQTGCSEKTVIFKNGIE